MNTILGILKSKWFWIGIGALILFIIIKRNWYKINRMFQPTAVNSELFDPEGKMTEDRKRELEAYARAIYDSIYSTTESFFGHSYEPYDRLLNLSDIELKYVSVYYRRNVTQNNWLWKDVNDEVFFIGNDRGNKLMARLAEIGEKG